MRDWNAREQDDIDYVAAPESDPERAWIGWYLDVGVAGTDPFVAAIDALSGTAALGRIARCSVGRRR